jgi:hypothetical protein
MQPPQLVAFYVPHFHPIPEASTWWGPGYTDWTQVVQARRRFVGHYQPHVPGDLGFYDLRLAESRAAQAALASRHGIGAFCYYHYWFDGRRLYEQPFEQMVASGKPDFPYCICWANEPWMRTWDGEGRQILLKANYSPLDDEHHFKALLPAFTDPRYLRKDGRPILVIQKAKDLPDPRGTAKRWQALARAHGLPGLFLVRMESSPEECGEPEIIGFDAAVEAQPEWQRFAEPAYREMWRKHLRRLRWDRPGRLCHNVVSYRALVQQALLKPRAEYTRFPTVCPGWDNSPSRKWDGVIFKESSPKMFEHWLRETISRDQPEFVFVHAWNDWANGCHLEPCRRWGRAYLEAAQAALATGKGVLPAVERTRIPVFKPSGAA